MPAENISISYYAWKPPKYLPGDRVGLWFGNEVFQARVELVETMYDARMVAFHLYVFASKSGQFFKLPEHQIAGLI